MVSHASLSILVALALAACGPTPDDGATTTAGDTDASADAGSETAASSTDATGSTSSATSTGGEPSGVTTDATTGSGGMGCPALCDAIIECFGCGDQPGCLEECLSTCQEYFIGDAVECLELEQAYLGCYLEDHCQDLDPCDEMEEQYEALCRQ
ncbi:MAG: hypothetical protein R3A51_10180 [Nannocystaceae bacterium]